MDFDNVTYYIIFTVAGTRAGQLGNVVARSRKEAIGFAIDEYRKEHNLPTSITVAPTVVFQTKDPEEADTFYNNLMTKVTELQKSGAN